VYAALHCFVSCPFFSQLRIHVGLDVHRRLLFPLQELLEDESNQLFFGEVGKQMVIGLMTKAEKVGSLYNNLAVSCEHRDTCSSISTQSFSSVMEGEDCSVCW